MALTQLAPMAPPTTYAEAMRLEVRAEAGRRGLSQSGLARLLELSQQAVSDRWRGRTPWSLDEVQRLEVVLALPAGTLFHRATDAAARGSQPIGRYVDTPGQHGVSRAALGLAA